MLLDGPSKMLPTSSVIIAIFDSQLRSKRGNDRGRAESSGKLGLRKEL